MLNDLFAMDTEANAHWLRGHHLAVQHLSSVFVTLKIFCILQVKKKKVNIDFVVLFSFHFWTYSMQ